MSVSVRAMPCPKSAISCCYLDSIAHLSRPQIRLGIRSTLH